MKGFAIFLLVSLGVVASCYGFVGQTLPNCYTRTPKTASCQVMNLRAREEGRTNGIDVRKALVHGIFSGLLLLSPALDLVTNNDGNVAFAQGATSSKSTRASPSVDANKDPESILRLSLPISNSKNVIRDAQVPPNVYIPTYFALFPTFP